MLLLNFLGFRSKAISVILLVEEFFLSIATRWLIMSNRARRSYRPAATQYHELFRNFHQQPMSSPLENLKQFHGTYQWGVRTNSDPNAGRLIRSVEFEDAQQCAWRWWFCQSQKRQPRLFFDRWFCPFAQQGLSLSEMEKGMTENILPVYFRCSLSPTIKRNLAGSRLPRSFANQGRKAHFKL